MNTATRTRPPSAHIDDQAADTIPDELRESARWIIWKWDRKGDRWCKPPFDPGKPRGKQHIDHLDRSVWLSFEAARENEHRGGDGIGFSLGRQGHADLAGVDFDHCLSDGRIRNPDVERWVKALDSYTEITPSGDGLRVWVKGRIPEKGRRKDDRGAEIYAKERYFTVTGRHWLGTPLAIERRQKALDSLWVELFGESAPKPKASRNGPARGRTTGSDDELIEKARNAKNGEKFKALFDSGDTSAYEDNDSTADLALMGQLAFWTGRNAERMEAIFGQSALGQREKWKDRADYRKQTIDMAIAGCETVYTPPGRNGSGNHGSTPTTTPTTPTHAGRPSFANSIRVKADEKTESKAVPILMPSLIDSLATVANGWPKRVGEVLFVESADHRPVYLDSSTQLMGWLDGIATVYWSRGPGMIGQERLYEYVRKFAAERFEAIESYPHEPPMPGNYYMHPYINRRTSSGLTEQFLDFFAPATPADRELIRAAALTPFWGGTPGARPAFRFDGPEDDPPELGGRGVGKTKSVELIAAPCGGLVDLRENESISDLITRLLSEEGRCKRILRIDNIKTLKLSWADLEAFITSQWISGKMLYRGEGRRPNTLTVFNTVNGGSLSKDMATRQVSIRLARPKPSGNWLRDAFRFIEDHRWELIDEFRDRLADEPSTFNPVSRWAEWEQEVLGRVPRWSECQALIVKRASELDADDDDAREIEGFFSRKLEERNHKPLDEIIKIPTHIAAEWFTEYNGKGRHASDAGTCTRILKTKPFKYLSYKRDAKLRHWLWVGEKAEGVEPVLLL